MTLAGCYNASVNESETISEAQPFCPVRKPAKPANRRAKGFQVTGFPVTGFPVSLLSGQAHIERS
ncbi:MAG: hypothetical protein Q8M18_06565 [Bradyrhizobium sp.]|nr:hypothetical protein [Bradyrhizobium sp.]